MKVSDCMAPSSRLNKSEPRKAATYRGARRALAKLAYRIAKRAK